tara:strand:- start:1815 stop:2099 length:285 start_codon:yes stop_codon:yes gene_type:complete
MPGYADDMHYDQPDDPWNPDEDDEFILTHWNEGYTSEEGIQTRLMEDMIDEEQLYASDYKLDESGNIKLKSNFDKFLRDNKIILAGLLFLGYMI